MAIGTGLLESIEGHFAGMTVYKKNGKTIVRTRHNSYKAKRRSRGQFALRQRLTHTNALWRALSETKMVFFEGGSSPCHRFRSINRECPTVYLTKWMTINRNSLLLPNMALSDGPLLPISYQLGDVDGKPALLTDLTKTEARKYNFMLYVLEQEVCKQQLGADLFQLSIKVEPVGIDDFINVPSTLLTPYKHIKGTLALVDDRFANNMLGFGLVRIKDGHASPQRVVTNCTYYEQFTTEEALQAAAKSYGGLTNEWK